MTPDSLMLGNAGQCFECGHELGRRYRCLSFYYAPDYFECLAADAGVRGPRADYRTLRVPPLRALSSLTARACAGLSMDRAVDVPWEELSVQLAAQTFRVVGGFPPRANSAPMSAEARVTRAVRAIERDPDAGLTLGRLAREAGLSRYHFLRTFQGLTGLTPHQYVLRARLREAAIRLTATESRERVLDIALDCGFGDVSNFTGPSALNLVLARASTAGGQASKLPVWRSG